MNMRIRITNTNFEKIFGPINECVTDVDVRPTSRSRKHRLIINDRLSNFSGVKSKYHILTIQPKQEILDWFDGNKKWRLITQDVDHGHNVTIWSSNRKYDFGFEFEDLDLAMLFKLTWL